MPKWRQTLLDNLQGLIAGNFEMDDFGDAADKEAELIDLDAFDAQALDQMAALLKGDLGVTVEEYLEDAAAYIRDIKAGLQENDARKVARGSHPLKSNSKGLGLTAVSQVATSINVLAEKAAKTGGNLETAGALVPQLQKALEKAEKRLRDKVKNGGP
jgi:HPt (histidine-containing phosphotransfer) domain-containing protein